MLCHLRLMPRFHRAVRYGLVRYGLVRYGAARFAYIGVSTAKSWAGSQNKRAKLYLFFDTPPFG